MCGPHVCTKFLWQSIPLKNHCCSRDLEVHEVIDSFAEWRELRPLGKTLVEHEHTDHVGHSARNGELRVDWPPAGRQLFDARDQLVHLELNGALATPLSEPEVAQRVQSEAPLLFPQRSFGFQQSYKQESLKLLKGISNSFFINDNCLF